jgi:DNA-binding NarL/FixJ family response regulator
MMDETATIGVLIVEDHAVVREGLHERLAAQDDMSVIGSTGRGDEAVQLVQETAPNVLLLDLELSNSPLTGLQVLEQVRTLSPTTHIVVLTEHLEDKYVFPAYRSGAIGYILKFSTSRQVIEAVRDAAKGIYHLDPLVANIIVDHMLRQNGTLREPAPSDNLTPREREVLALLQQDKSNQDIARALNVTVATVKTHVSNILHKLNLRSRHELEERRAGQ